jgi:DNA-binding NarL/FixJ family response regulator
MIRIAIVEDNEELSMELSGMFHFVDDFTCRVFPDGQHALRGITADEFDVVLMDIKMPGMSGIECTHLLKEKYPALRIMMCTVLEDDAKIFGAIAAGASGYILKRTEPVKLIQSIRELMDGGAPISNQIAQKVLSAFRQMMPKNVKENPLSDREQEVLTLLALGHTNKEVADKMNVSRLTVKTHIYNIYQKLHVGTRVEAINKFKNQTKSQ